MGQTSARQGLNSITKGNTCEKQKVQSIRLATMLAGLRSRRRLVWAGFAALLLTLASILAPLPAQARPVTTPTSAITVSDDEPLIIVGVGGLVWQIGRASCRERVECSGEGEVGRSM